MCNNRVMVINLKDEKELHLFKLGQWSGRLCRGESKAQIAESEGITEEELEKYLEEIKDINPTLYKQIKSL